jgi:hypothetical protein
MVWQVVYAVVAEVVYALVSPMMCQTDCAAVGEMVTAMDSGTKAGMLVHMPGDATGKGRAVNRMSAQSAEAWFRSSPATSTRAWMKFGDASAQVASRLARFGLA